MKQNSKSFFDELLYGKLFPLLLIVIMACTYAIQLPHLGFYLDDWVSIAAYDQGGEAGLLAFGINDSRPFSAWVTAKFFAVLGTGVLPWQLITLFWRFAASMTCFYLLTSIWPEKRKRAGFISLLFAVFPYFKHQAICIAYFMILMQYFVILLSFLLTVKALFCQNKALKTILFLLSYAASLFHLSCLEYYLSLEAARLIIIFVVLKKRDGKSFRETLGKAILIYIPYALILVYILVYRFIYIPSLSKDVRPVNMFSKYKGLNIIFHLIGMFIQFLTESFLGVWYRSLNPSGIDLTIHNAQLALGLGLLAAGFVFLTLRKTRKDQPSGILPADYEMLILGAAAMLLGFLPGMAIDSSPAANSNYNDRYLLPSFWGIAIFTVTCISVIVRNGLLRDLLFSGMICIAVFFQIQNSYMYRYSWKYQQQFQWQLKWRVPDIEANTALVSDGVVASFMGGWADSSMLFEMYGKKEGLSPTPYWYFNIGEDNYLSAVGTDEQIYIKSKMYEFLTDSENILAVTKPEWGKCVWVVDEADVDNPYLEAGIRPYINYQNKSRMILDSEHKLPTAIFGSDYIHDWCYYFEKADLAFDRQEYAEALRLYDEAAAKGIRIGNATEMRPFIKSAAFAGEWEKALEWTETANNMNPDRTTDYFENLWRILDRDVPDSAEKSEAMIKVREILASGK
ncbi:MAG: hypothetical protein IKP86_12545 [Anaerolineaceae bacterium]|nr:hypothetical protein [Anaerolineaceae bacterium]